MLFSLETERVAYKARAYWHNFLYPLPIPNHLGYRQRTFLSLAFLYEIIEKGGIFVRYR